MREQYPDRQHQLEMRREQEKRFTDENWMVRVNNELHSDYLPLDEAAAETRSVRHLHLLAEAEQFYRDTGDDFNVFRLALKRGDLTEAEQLTTQYLDKTDETNVFGHYTSRPGAMHAADLLSLKKAYVVSDLAKHKQDGILQREAYRRFIGYADGQAQREELSGYEASALAYWQARRLAPRDERDTTTARCLAQFRKVAADRAAVGDRWWESIALRQIGKISNDPADRAAALQRSEELIGEYVEMNDYKKAALWARDVNDLDPSPEHARRMEGLWEENIRRMEKDGDTRNIGKSCWSLYKRMKKYDPSRADDYRLRTIEYYEKLLTEEKAKEQPNEGRIRECYWAFSELVK